jgi:hypothetical protein
MHADNMRVLPSGANFSCCYCGSTWMTSVAQVLLECNMHVVATLQRCVLVKHETFKHETFRATYCVVRGERVFIACYKALSCAALFLQAYWPACTLLALQLS